MVSMIFAVLTTLLLLWAGVSMFIWFLRYDLRMFQQHSYRPERFWRWWGGSGNWFSAFLDWMLRIPAKLPLVVTARVKRLMATDILLTLLLFCAGVWGLLRLSGASSTGVLPWNGWALPLAVCLMILTAFRAEALGPGEVPCSGAVLAEKEPERAAEKSSVEEGGADWTLYACIGGGVIVFAAVVGILAGGKKK